MSYWPILKHLGFGAEDRVIIFNADDFGMCESSISAVDELAEAGILSAASIMPPCPWFPLAAEWSRHHPDFSVGVHLTLTSEWQGYRWRPCCSAPETSGLIDQQGYLHQQRDAVAEHADPHWVAVEIEAQVRAAIESGIDISHLDAHMYTVMLWPFLQHYLDMAQRFTIPAVLWPLSQRPHFGYEAQQLMQAEQLLNDTVAAGQAFLLDRQLWTRMAPPVATVDSVKQQLSDLPAGLTRFYIHPAKDSSELRRIVPDWQCRVADYKVFSSSELERFIRGQGIYIIGYREIQQAMKQLYKPAG